MPSVESRSFRDFDAFRQQLVGWDCDPVQLDAGRLRIQWDSVEADGIALATMCASRAIADVSALEPGRVGFVVTLEPQQWCGVDVTPGSLIVMNSGREQRSRLTAGFRSLEIAGPRDAFLEAGIDGRELGRLEPEECVLPLEANAAVRFAEIAAAIQTRSSQHVSAAWAHTLRRRALAQLGDTVRRSASPRLRRTPRYELAVAGMQLIDGSLSDRPSVKQLCAALGVTPRALEYAFRSALGVSPSQYALARRLELVRGRLSRESRTSVTTEAYRQGFGHLGRFASQYERLFGELPSRTQRSARVIARR